MDLLTILDGTIEDLLNEGHEPEEIAKYFLDEDFRVELEEGEVLSLLEVVKKTYRTLPGGGKMLMRKSGRPSAARSAAAKRASMKGKAARARKAKLTRMSPKFRMAQAARARIRASKRPRSGPARRPKRPSVKRPKVRRHGPPRRGRPARHSRPRAFRPPRPRRPRTFRPRRR